MTENKFKTIPKNIIIPDQENFNKLIEIFKEQGKDKIHALADFDRTLTKCFVDGEKITSLISILRKEGFLNPEYSKRTFELFDQYHPIEIDPNIPAKEKKAKMAQWWRLHNAELVKHGLNKEHLEKVIKSSKIQFREGALEFLDSLKHEGLPLVILSSSGLGGYAIPRLLEREGRLSENIQVISNSFEFDDNGQVIKFNEPVIHVLNKDEAVVKDFPDIYEKIKERKNVILLGDNIEDNDMVEGFDYDNIIRIGFLNDKVEENLEAYKKNFNIVITDDSDMNFVNDLLKELL
jgi:7-methylguanosine nucleotidase